MRWKMERRIVFWVFALAAAIFVFAGYEPLIKQIERVVAPSMADKT